MDQKQPPAKVAVSSGLVRAMAKLSSRFMATTQSHDPRAGSVARSFLELSHETHTPGAARRALGLARADSPRRRRPRPAAFPEQGLPRRGLRRDRKSVV